MDETPRGRRLCAARAWTVLALGVASVSFLGGCAASLQYTWVDDLSSEAMLPQPYRIHAGDELAVLVWNQENLSVTVRVRPDGMVTLPLVGDIAVGGLTAEGAAKQAARRLDGIVVEPKVTMNLTAMREATYSIIGEVANAGTFPLRDGDGVLHAIATAGGLTQFASRDDVYVLRKDPELTRIRFSYDALIHAGGNGVLFRLRDGDIVVAE